LQLPPVIGTEISVIATLLLLSLSHRVSWLHQMNDTIGRRDERRVDARVWLER
jgi:hypothetical protein